MNNATYFKVKSEERKQAAFKALELAIWREQRELDRLKRLTDRRTDRRAKHLNKENGC